MHCLHICNDFSGSKVHSKLYESLDELGLAQTIYNPLRKETSKGNNVIDFKNKKSKILHSPLLKKKHSYIYSSKINFLYKNLISQCDPSTFDIVHATTLFSDGALALKLNEAYGTPYIIAVRATDIHVFFKYRPDLIFLAKKILQSAYKIVFISNSLKKQFDNHYLVKKFIPNFDDKTAIIYNGINNFWLNNLEVSKEIKTPYKIIYVGQLIQRKNIIALSKAVIELNKNNYPTVLTIVGDGPLKKEIITISNNEPSSIKYIGSINSLEDLKNCYNENQIFAMPAIGETFGLVYIEALTQNLPILYCKDEAIDGVFDKSIGSSCQPTVEGIYNGLIEIFENYNHFNIDQINFSKFNWDIISKKYVTIYNICDTN